MPLFPLFVDLKGKRCVVVGGGRVAARKIGTLLEFEADITVVSPETSDPVKQLGADGKLRLIEKAYSQEDIIDAFLVIAVTCDTGVNRKICDDAAAINIFVNVADNPESCTFFFPSVVRRGRLVAGISTSGSFPGLTGYVRRKIEGVLPESLSEAADLLAEGREQVMAAVDRQEKRSEVLRRMLEEAMDCCDAGNVREAGVRIKRILEECGNEKRNSGRQP
jgi:precorrin-2 dehydrogenase/sirohydrochlorin ferrochelatase